MVLMKHHINDQETHESFMLANDELILPSPCCWWRNEAKELIHCLTRFIARIYPLLNIASECVLFYVYHSAEIVLELILVLYIYIVFNQYLFPSLCPLCRLGR